MKITFNPTTKTQTTDKQDRWIQKASNNYVYLYGADSTWDVKATFTRRDGEQIGNISGIYDVDPDSEYCHVIHVPTQACELDKTLSVSIIINEPSGDDYIRHSTIKTSGYLYPNDGVIVPDSLSDELVNAINLAIANLGFNKHEYSAIEGIDGETINKDTDVFSKLKTLAEIAVEINKIIDGTYTAKKAEQDDHGNDINETYETKEDATTAKGRITANETFIEFLQLYKENINNKIISLAGNNWDYLYSSTDGGAYAYDFALTNLNDANVTPGVDVNGYSLDDVVRVSDGDITTPTYYWYKVVEAEESDINYMSAKLIKALLDLKETAANKGALNGYAPLVNGKVPSAYMPNGYDNYEEVATYADLPTEGVEGTVYVVIADETSGGNTSTYRWTGSVYGKISDTLSASEVKTLYEANADVNAYTDAEKTKLTALYTKTQFDTLFNDRYTKAEVQIMINDLKTIYGWEIGDLTPTALTNEDTLALTAISGYDKLLFVARVTADDTVFTQKIPVSELTNGTVIEFFNNANINATVDATNITFNDVGTTETLKIYGVKMDKSQFYEIRNIQEQSITYRADGKVSQVVGDNVTTTPTYDTNGNLTKITEVYALDGKTYETTFIRDALGRIINTNKQEVI
jgi:hypothetical protein